MQTMDKTHEHMMDEEEEEGEEMQGMSGMGKKSGMPKGLAPSYKPPKYKTPKPPKIGKGGMSGMGGMGKGKGWQDKTHEHM